MTFRLTLRDSTRNALTPHNGLFEWELDDHTFCTSFYSFLLLSAFVCVQLIMICKLLFPDLSMYVLRY